MTQNERKDVLHKEVEHEIDISQPLTFYQKFMLTSFQKFVFFTSSSIRVLLKKM